MRRKSSRGLESSEFLQLDAKKKGGGILLMWQKLSVDFPADLCTVGMLFAPQCCVGLVLLTLGACTPTDPLTKAERQRFDLRASLNQHQTGFAQRSTKSSDRHIPKASIS